MQVAQNGRYLHFDEKEPLNTLIVETLRNISRYAVLTGATSSPSRGT